MEAECEARPLKQAPGDGMPLLPVEGAAVGQGQVRRGVWVMLKDRGGGGGVKFLFPHGGCFSISILPTPVVGGK